MSGDEVDNDARAGWATAALDAFGAHTGQTDYDYQDPQHLEEIAGDLVGNVLHLARAPGVNVEALIRRARLHFDAEVEEAIGD